MAVQSQKEILVHTLQQISTNSVSDVLDKLLCKVTGWPPVADLSEAEGRAAIFETCLAPLQEHWTLLDSHQIDSLKVQIKECIDIRLDELRASLLGSNIIDGNG